jgi:CO/xanthine dehydrogenase FAD-binding subunit
VPQRLTALESALKGKPVNRMPDFVRSEHLAGLTPVTDVRGTGDYRRDASLELAKRTLAEFARC